MIRRHSGSILGILVVAFFLFTAEPAAAAYSFIDVNFPGASWTVASAINDSGQIVGYYSDGSGVRHGFLLNAGAYTTIDCPSPYTAQSAANGINSSGQIVGDCAAPGGVNGVYGSSQSFLLNGGVLTFLSDVPGGSYNGASTFAQAINDSGQIVGWYADPCLCAAHGFLLSAGTYSTIDVLGFGSSYAYGINNSGQITGTTQPGFGTGGAHGFLLNGGNYTLIDDPDTGSSSGTIADSINSSGKVAGYYSNGANNQGFLLDGGTFTTIDHQNALSTIVGGINSQGQLVGAYTDSSNVLHGFLMATPVQPNSLVSYWPLDFGRAVDNQGNSSGTATNTTAIVGRVNSGLHFDGVDSVVTTPYAPFLDASKMAQMTAESWVRFSQSPPVFDTYLNLVGKEATSGPCCWSYELVVRQHPSLNGGQPFFTWRVCSNGNQQQCNIDFETAPYATIPLDTNWHHVAGTFDAGTGAANLYVDGTLARTWTAPIGYMQNDPSFGIQIGGFTPSGYPWYTNPFDLDEVALWSRVLVPSEILSHYQAGLAGLNYFPQDLLVGDLGDSSIKEFDGITGGFKSNLVSPGAGQIQTPTFPAFGPDGNLYVNDCAARSVKRYNGITGAYIDDFVPAGSEACYAIAFGPDGNLYVASRPFTGDTPSGVKRYNGSTGAFIDQFVQPGSGGLDYPQGFVFGPDGNLYVADNGFYDGTSDTGNAAIRRYDGKTGAFIDNFVPLGQNSGDPGSLTFGPDGNLYVDFFYGGNIQRYNGTTGADMGSLVQGLYFPGAIAFGPDDDLYVDLHYNQVVQRYDASGNHLNDFVATGLTGEISSLTWVPANRYLATTNGSAPSASLSSSSLIFASQNVGTTSPTQSATLTNTGNATLNLSSISANGDFALAATGTSCPYGGGTVAAGTNCTIDVSFTPTATGARTGTVTITDNATGSPQIVNLSGTGVAPAVSFSVAALAFGNQVTNTTSAAQSVTLTNTGSGVLSLSSVAITGTNPADFAISANPCGPTVAPGANCSISVTFTPLGNGARAASLTLIDNASTSPQSVNLTGNGLNPLAVTPAILAFGNEGAGTTSAAKNVTLRNNTSASVTITGTSFTGPNATEFAQAATTCGSSLAAHASCTISITFSPVAVGAESATLSITDSAANSPQAVTFSGTGVQPVTLSVATLNFGNQGIASTSDPKNVTVKNNNSVALNFTGMTITGTNAADYAESATTCGSSLGGHSACIISVTFTPSGPGTETAALSITDNAGNNPQTVALTGVGVQQVTLSGATLSFGSQVINTTSAAKNVTMRNNTSADLTITGTTITGPNATQFAQAGTTCGATLAAHSTCILSVSFSPIATGAASATLTITDSATNSPQTIALTGTGIVPVSLTPASLTFATLKVGNSSAAKTVTVDNNLSITLNISGITISGANGGDFSRSATTCGSTLAPNASCSVSIVFTPTAVGARSASLNVSDDASTSPQSVGLSGTGK
jgi:centrosomal CEP192-like protein/ASPM-SPD-2-Hydin domain-containing protein